MKRLVIVFLGQILFLQPTNCLSSGKLGAAKAVLQRTLGTKIAQRFVLKLTENPNQNMLEYYSIKSKDDTIYIEANSPVALCRASYQYLKNQHNNIINWSGSHIELPGKLQNTLLKGNTPYQYRYYFNVVTHDYTTAYWDWPRWQQEIDWMAMHGINMPLITGAHEAILYRVFRELGLTLEESIQYFSGPAHFPWNRMGNLTAWDGAQRLPKSYFDQQIALQHKILKRLRTLGMQPIAPAFAGFVPPSLQRLNAEADIHKLSWGGGLPERNSGYILSPNSPLFKKNRQPLYKTWEKEFGENKYYLADSFNEMDVPPSNSEAKLLTELAAYGESAYQAISAANPKAVLVMQGWAFPYHKDNKGMRFWTPKRLATLISRVPDDKLLILNLANEYNYVFWKIDPSWKMYEGFFNKQWIYSFIPNMVGRAFDRGLFSGLVNFLVALSG